MPPSRMRSALRIAVSTAGLVVAVGSPVHGQGSDTVSAAQRAGRALARLGGGELVRIQRSGAGRVEGRVVNSSADLVTLRAGSSTVTLTAPGVDSLWVRSGTHAGTGALIGAVLGGLAFGTVAALVEHDLCSETPGGGSCNETGAFVIGFALGGAGGGGIGALVGASVPRWQRWVP